MFLGSVKGSTLPKNIQPSDGGVAGPSSGYSIDDYLMELMTQWISYRTTQQIDEILANFSDSPAQLVTPRVGIRINEPLGSGGISESIRDPLTVGPVFDQTPDAAVYAEGVRGMQLLSDVVMSASCSSTSHCYGSSSRVSRALLDNTADVRASNGPTDEASKFIQAIESLLPLDGREFWLMQSLPDACAYMTNEDLNRSWMLFSRQLATSVSGLDILNQFDKCTDVTDNMMAAAVALFHGMDEHIVHSMGHKLFRHFIDPRDMSLASCHSRAAWFQPNLLAPWNFLMHMLPLLISWWWSTPYSMVGGSALQSTLPGAGPLFSSQSPLRQLDAFLMWKLTRSVVDRVIARIAPNSPQQGWRVTQFLWGGKALDSNEEAFMVAMFSLFFNGSDKPRQIETQHVTQNTVVPVRKGCGFPFK